MPTIEITGPDEKGMYSVEMESDADESAEQSGGDASASASPDASGAMPTDDGSGDDGSESGESPDSGNTIQCGSVKEVLQAVKSLLQGEGMTGNTKAMWDQEASKTAAAKQQSNLY